MNNETLLTGAEAANFLSIHYDTLKKYRENNKGPKYVRYGHRIYYRPQDLNAFLDDHTVDPASAA